MTNTEDVKAVLSDSPEVAQLKTTLNVSEVLAQVETYRNNAEASLAKLQENIDKLTTQLDSLQKMRLMVMGQRELVLDLLGKMSGPVADKPTN